MEIETILGISIPVIIGIFVIGYFLKKTKPKIEYRNNYYPTKREGKAYKIEKNSDGKWFSFFNGKKILGNTSNDIFDKLKELEGVK